MKKYDFEMGYCVFFNYDKLVPSESDEFFRLDEQKLTGLFSVYLKTLDGGKKELAMDIVAKSSIYELARIGYNNKELDNFKDRGESAEFYLKHRETINDIAECYAEENGKYDLNELIYDFFDYEKFGHTIYNATERTECNIDDDDYFTIIAIRDSLVTFVLCFIAEDFRKFAKKYSMKNCKNELDFIEFLGFSVEKNTNGYNTIEYNGKCVLGESSDTDANKSPEDCAAIFLEHMIDDEKSFRKEFFETVCEDKEDEDDVLSCNNDIDWIYDIINSDNGKNIIKEIRK